MAKKKSKPKDKIREKIKKEKNMQKRMNNQTVRFRCLECGIEEEIPKDIVQMLDLEDGGDLSVPPRFECEECDGLMEPIHYVSVHGVTYDIEV